MNNIEYIELAVRRALDKVDLQLMNTHYDDRRPEDLYARHTLEKLADELFILNEDILKRQKKNNL